MANNSKKRTSGRAAEQLSGLVINEMPVEKQSGNEAELQREINRLKKQVAQQSDAGELQQRIRELEDNLASAYNSIVRVDEKRWRFRRFEMSSIGILETPNDLNEEEVIELGVMLSSLGSAVNFWIGDWANMWIGDEKDNAVRKAWYKKIADQFDMKTRTIQNVAQVCRKLDSTLRREELNFSIHRAIADAPDELNKTALLDWAIEHHPTVRKFEEYIESQLSNKSKDKITISEGLFAKNRLPKINPSLQKLLTKAKNGDENARTKLLGHITKIRKWVDDLENDMDS